MVGIHGIDGISELANRRRVDVRATNSVATTVDSEDNVSISRDAQTAAAVAQAQAISEQAAEIREERVAQARESIEQGTYRIQDVVKRVAARIARYIAV